MRDEKGEEGKLGVKECKEPFLWPLGLELLGFCSRRYREPIINFRRGGCCEDSPRGEMSNRNNSPVCLLPPPLNSASLLILLSVCLPASPPPNSHTKKMQMLMKFQPVIYQAVPETSIHYCCYLTLLRQIDQDV